LVSRRVFEHENRSKEEYSKQSGNKGGESNQRSAGDPRPKEVKTWRKHRVGGENRNVGGGKNYEVPNAGLPSQVGTGDNGTEEHSVCS